MLYALVAVEHGHGEQDCAELPDAEEDRGRLRRRRQHHRNAVAPGHAARGERLRGLVREVLQLAPVELARRAVEALPDHRRLVARMLVADVRGDAVALRHVPAMVRAELLVARPAHGTPRSSHVRGLEHPDPRCAVWISTPTSTGCSPWAA